MSAEQPAGADGPSGSRRREIVSFVRRGRRLSPGRQAAWDRAAARWVLSVPMGDRDTLPAPGCRLDPAAVFGRRAPLVVEIGSGQGENIAAAAARHPERDHLAFEVYRPGVAQTLDRLERVGSPDNVRLLLLDALGSLPILLPPASIHEVWIFFPDPWHKARHHKRRLVGPTLLEVLDPLMAPGGILRLATDWSEYAGHMRSVLDAADGWENLHPHGSGPEGHSSDPVPPDFPSRGWAPRFEGRVLTSFERKAADAGRLVHDLAYRRVTSPGERPSEISSPPRTSEDAP